MVWHKSKFKSTACTNSGDYPIEWEQPSLAQYYIFETVEECCAQVKNQQPGEMCDILDVEEPWDCDKWHLSIELEADGITAVDPLGTCTNTGVVHEVWAAYAEHYILPTFEDCCKKFNLVGPGRECNEVNACAEATTASPTPVPVTKAPTPAPITKAPTPAPITKAPTPVPTTTTNAPTGKPTTSSESPGEMEQNNAELSTCEKASKSFHPDQESQAIW